MSHIPVLLDAVLAALLPDGHRVQRVIDGTLGAGGHSRALLDAGVETILGLDLDAQALAIARETLAAYVVDAQDTARRVPTESKPQIIIVHASYADMQSVAHGLGWQGVDDILLDLGVSSMQLDTAERGFAFRHEGLLDMRFDPGSDRPPASELVNYWDEVELRDLFFRYGEEKFSKRVAQAVIKHRPYETTTQLAEVVANAIPAKFRYKERIHPATRVFQALRIAVNDELTILEETLPKAIDLLNPGGRLVVISFHSLEDRIVKQVFKQASSEIVSPPGMVLEEKQATVKLITRKPIIADEIEMGRNPRSRSAKLRVVEKL